MDADDDQDKDTTTNISTIAANTESTTRNNTLLIQTKNTNKKYTSKLLVSKKRTAIAANTGSTTLHHKLLSIQTESPPLLLTVQCSLGAEIKARLNLTIQFESIQFIANGVWPADPIFGNRGSWAETVYRGCVQSMLPL